MPIKYRETKFEDSQHQNVQKEISRAVTALSERADTLSSPAVFMSASGVVPVGASAVIWVGPAGGTIKLPLSTALGRTTAAIIAIANATMSAVTIRANAAAETINGTSSLSLSANGMTMLIADGNGHWFAIASSQIGYKVLAIRSLTGASSAVTAGTTAALVWGRAQGGGGGASNFGTSNGGGGAQGGWFLHFTTSIPANWTHTGISTVGGVGGSPGSNPGTDGDDLTFTDDSVTVTAHGGPGGSAANLGGAPPAISTNASLINGSGAPGGNSDGGNIHGGNGGGDGGGQGSDGSAPGGDGLGPGAGGGGAFNSGGSNFGGDGAGSKLLIIELGS